VTHCHFHGCTYTKKEFLSGILEVFEFLSIVAIFAALESGHSVFCLETLDVVLDEVMVRLISISSFFSFLCLRGFIN
jgi:hypothetical protein